MTEVDDLKDEWFIWVVKIGKYDHVETFLRSIPEIKEILYPTETREIRLRSNLVKKKRIPLYTGYLFLRYKNSPEMHQKLKGNPFITTYVGQCTGKDLEKVREVKILEEWNVKNKKFEVNDSVKVNSGPFKGFTGEVIEISSNGIVLSVEVFGRKTKVTISKDDADIFNRKR